MKGTIRKLLHLSIGAVFFLQDITAGTDRKTMFLGVKQNNPLITNTIKTQEPQHTKQRKGEVVTSGI